MYQHLLFIFCILLVGLPTDSLPITNQTVGHNLAPNNSTHDLSSVRDTLALNNLNYDPTSDAISFLTSITLLIIINIIFIIHFVISPLLDDLFIYILFLSPPLILALTNNIHYL